MTDKTLGAYTRHEKHDAADFAKARFATRPDGQFAARLVTGTHPELYPWRCSDIPGRSDRAMAEDGFVPVRECPDPDEHVRYDAALAGAEKAERELDHLATVLETTARQRDEADKRNARPLTPDAITEEMVERFRSALHPQQRLAGFLVEAGLRAALTEPPTRRLEAERLDPIIDAVIRGHSDIASPAVVHAIADALAEEGVYVPEVGR